MFLPIIIIGWSIILLIFEFIEHEIFIELINVIFGMFLSGYISYDAFINSDIKNSYRAIIGLIEIAIGAMIIPITFNLVHSGLILMIGGELIGINLAIGTKKKTSMGLPSTTKKPETLDPEPQPEPSPF